MGKIDVFTLVEANAEHPRHDSATIVELDNGSLMLAWMEYVGGEAMGHDHAPSNIASMISNDGGYTWTDHRILVENAPGDTNVHYPCLLRLQSGDILFYYLRYHHISPGTPLEASSFVCRSSDEGKTFSSPTKHEFKGRPLIQLSTGRIILPVLQVLGDWCGPTDHQIAGACYSDDDGYTWKESDNWVDLPMRGALEPHIAELRDGRLLMFLRTQLGAIFQSHSADGGATWSKGQTTGLKGPESMRCLARIPKTGDLLLIWNNSLYDPEYDHYGKRTPLTVAISRDDGRSWENVKNIETDPNGRFTNPSCHFTSQDRVIITYIASQTDASGKGDHSCVPLKAAITDLEWFYE